MVERDSNGRFIVGGRNDVAVKFQKGIYQGYGFAKGQALYAHNVNCQCFRCQPGQVPKTAFRKGHKLGVGKKHTQETKRKIGLANSGKNSYLWKGGISKDTKKYRQRRKALEKGGGELPIERIQLVYEDNIKKYGTLTCYLCEISILFGKDHLEHKIPLSRGGTNEYNNLAVACKKCNHSKRTKTEKEYREWVKKEEI